MATKMNFHVGQKVVCVDVENYACPGAPGDSDRLRKGAIYTISKVGVLKGGRPGVNLAELREAPGYDVRYFSGRFRPVMKRSTETGMAILREIIDRESHQDKPPVKRTVHS